MLAVLRTARCSIRRVPASSHWRPVALRHFSDDPSDTADAAPAASSSTGEDAPVSESSKSQIDMVASILEDVEEYSTWKVEQSKQAMKEPTFGELFSSLGLTDADMNNWFKAEDFPEEQRPILEELSQQEVKMRLKEKRRAEEMRRLKEQAESRVRVVDNLGRAHGRGGRKTSRASVWLSEGTGNIRVNDMSYDLYFRLLDHRVHVLEPFCVTNTLGKFDVEALVRGGGLTGQAGAVRHGISRAIQFFDPSLRPPLRKGGFLTRDPRVVERKKPGKAKARKSFQWVKR